MKPRRVGMTARIAENEAKLCKACGTRNRKSIGPWCERCKTRQLHHGDPKGKVIPLGAYKNERREMGEFLKKWQSAPQITAALKIIGDWITSAGAGKDVPGKRLLAGYSDQGVQPRKVLLEVLCGWLFIRRNPAATENTIYSLYQFVRRAGRSYHESHPGKYRSPPSTERKEIGEFIFHTFVGLMLSIERALEDAEALRNERISILSKPFDAEELRASNRRKWRAMQLNRPLDWVDGRLKGGSGPAKRAAMKFPIPLRQGGMRPRKENEKT